MSQVLQEYSTFIGTFAVVLFAGLTLLWRQSSRKKTLQTRLQGRSTAGEIEGRPPTGARLLNRVANIGNYLSHGRASTSLKEEMTRAGYYDKRAPAVFLGFKMLLLSLGLLAAVTMLVAVDVSVKIRVLIIVAVGTMLLFLPNLYLKLRCASRREDLQRNLSDTVDLMEICVSAGMGLDMTWNVVSNEIRPVCPALADEMALTNLEIHLGTPRARAIRNMADRGGVEEISSLAAVLVQTERFGTSIATALRTFSASMREERTFRVEEKAEKMAVKLLFPMVLLIFPAVLIVVAGPAIITLTEIVTSG